MALVLGMMACSSMNPEPKSISALEFSENDIAESFVKMNLIAQ